MEILIMETLSLRAAGVAISQPEHVYPEHMYTLKIAEIATLFCAISMTQNASR